MQDNKPVIKLKSMFGNKAVKTYSMKIMYSGKVLFHRRRKKNRNHFDESTNIKNNKPIICKLKVPINPLKILINQANTKPHFSIKSVQLVPSKLVPYYLVFLKKYLYTTSICRLVVKRKGWT